MFAEPDSDEEEQQCDEGYEVITSTSSCIPASSLPGSDDGSTDGYPPPPPSRPLDSSLLSDDFDVTISPYLPSAQPVTDMYRLSPSYPELRAVPDWDKDSFDDESFLVSPPDSPLIRSRRTDSDDALDDVVERMANVVVDAENRQKKKHDPKA